VSLARFVTLVCAAAGIALTATPRAAAPQVPAFRAGIDLVNVGVTVIDRTGGLVADLGRADFEIREDGRTQTISYFLAGDPAAGTAPGLHVGVLLDVSESMAEEIGFARTAAIKFLNALEGAADMTVVDFDTEVRVARFGRDDFPRLVERIRQRKVSGLTALYDAIGVYLDGASDRDGRTIMLLYTDGGDTRSTLTLPELMDLLKASNVTVYAIGSLSHQSLSGRNRRNGCSGRFEVTGGRRPRRTSRTPIRSDQAPELRAHTMGISHQRQGDGTWRKVDVKVSGPGAKGLRIRARKGYFAPYKP
jgi:Ca-activated chloride channel family protein